VKGKVRFWAGLGGWAALVAWGMLESVHASHIGTAWALVGFVGALSLAAGWGLQEVKSKWQ
jgi:hypothetical protein